MDFLIADMLHAPFWIAVGQIIGVNIILSGDNAVVIALACMQLSAAPARMGDDSGRRRRRFAACAVHARRRRRPWDTPALKLVGGVLLLSGGCQTGRSGP